MTEMIKLESENVLDILSILNDYVWSFDWDKYLVDEETYGFCCDTGNYSSESLRDNVSEVYWTLINYGGDSNHPATNHFVIEYSEDGRGIIDRNAPVVIGLLDNDMCEFTNRYFTITPKQ
jgi:hypothetical protein